MFFGLGSPYPPSPKPPTTHRCILYLLTQSLLFKGPKYKINYAFPYFFFRMQKKSTYYYSFIFEIIVRASAFAMCCLASSSPLPSSPRTRARTLKNSKWTDPLSSLRIQFLVRLTPASNKWMASQIYIHTQPPYILLLYYSSWHLFFSAAVLLRRFTFWKINQEKKFFFAAIIIIINNILYTIGKWLLKLLHYFNLLFP